MLVSLQHDDKGNILAHKAEFQMPRIRYSNNISREASFPIDHSIVYTVAVVVSFAVAVIVVFFFGP